MLDVALKMKANGSMKFAVCCIWIDFYADVEDVSL
jgi:hypothetical protein